MYSRALVRVKMPGYNMYLPAGIYLYSVRVGVHSPLVDRRGLRSDAPR